MGFKAHIILDSKPPRATALDMDKLNTLPLKIWL